MDAGLAKVLNSTVGTSDFQPLDKVLRNQKTIVASKEDPLVTLYTKGDIGSIPYGENNAKTVLAFTCKNPGSFLFAYEKISTSNPKLAVKVTVNGAEIGNVELNGTAEPSYTNAYAFPAGATVRIKMYKNMNGTNDYYDYVKLMARTVELPFELI